MDLVQSRSDIAGGGKSFFSHVFNTSEDSNAEIMNASQYALLGVIPIVLLNKLIQKFVPEADPDKSTMELLVEVILQILVMFIGVIFIHRIITFVPTYSGFKYDHMVLTHVILVFLMVVLSIQTKLGLKVNILVDRVSDLWNGSSSDESRQGARKRVRFNEGFSEHAESQADHLGSSGPSSMFPPAPVVQSRPSNGGYDTMMRGSPQQKAESFGPMAANSVLGGAFGAF